MAEGGNEQVSRKEASTAVLQQSDPNGVSNITELCHETFSKAAEYLHGELACTAEDYRLLEQMNRATTAKYSEMKQIASNINRNMRDLNLRYDSLQTYLDQIDQIEEAVCSLEQAAYKLDTYSKQLENKFKELEKSSSMGFH